MHEHTQYITYACGYTRRHKSRGSISTQYSPVEVSAVQSPAHAAAQRQRSQAEVQGQHGRLVHRSLLTKPLAVGTLIVAWYVGTYGNEVDGVPIMIGDVVTLFLRILRIYYNPYKQVQYATTTSSPPRNQTCPPYPRKKHPVSQPVENACMREETGVGLAAQWYMLTGDLNIHRGQTWKNSEIFAVPMYV